MKSCKTSLVDDVPLTVSPDIKSPLRYAILNSVTSKLPWVKSFTPSTIAVAPEVRPVIFWLTNSLPTADDREVVLMISLLLHSPSEACIINFLG